MRVVTDAGTIELGTVETAPTIGVIDYSRRVTDDFGVTTVVKRGFARRMSVRLAVPFDDVDGIQRQLAALRATPATWIADDRFASLAFKGIYKEFELDLATPPLSYCTLTVEGLLDSDTFYDNGIDPAPVGQSSTLQVLQPLSVTDAMLPSSSVTEADAPEWAAGTTYAAGARVMNAATHRIYESLVAGNVGANPANFADRWVDVGPTNRWAMFDQAIGTATTASAPIVVILRPGSSINGLALLDTNAATIRVQAPGYDRTITVTGAIGSALFLDLVAAAGAAITVTAAPRAATSATPSWADDAGWLDAAPWHDTVAGDGTVAVGTLLLGTLKPLGITESSPTAGITDYSRKETDDFGETTVVPRAWAKRMAAKALIRTDAVDQVTSRIATIRALPSLWFADSAIDSLTVYGFFKDFSIEVGEGVSKLSLSIEGFAEAAMVAPLSIPWDNVSDTTGTKPEPNADVTGDNTSKDTAAVGGKPAGQVLAEADAIKRRIEILENITMPAVAHAVDLADAAIKAAGEEADAGFAEADRKIAAAAATADQAATRANARIDQAMTDLTAEAARAQGVDEQLARQIDTLTLTTTGNDAQVRALIDIERTVRTDSERAIGQSITAVQTDFIARDAATNARISSTSTTLSAADKALGERIDTVTTDYQGRDVATNTRITQQGSALSDADTAIGKRIDSVVAQVGTNNTNTTAEVSRVDLASTTRDQALGQRIDTVSADYKSLDSATNARITQQSTTLTDADAAIGRRIDSVETDYKGKDAATNTRITDQVTALSSADAAIGQRVDAIETDYKGRDAATNARITQQATASSDADSALSRRISTIEAAGGYDDTAVRASITRVEQASVDRDTALGQRSDTIQASLNDAKSRLTTVETATTDGRFATAQRVSTIEATLNGSDGTLAATIDQRATAIVDPKVGAVAQTVAQLRSDYNGTAAAVTQQAGTIAGLGQRTAAYWEVQAVAGNGRALLRVHADANNGGGVEIGGDLYVSGDAVIEGTVRIGKLDRSTMTASTAGSVSGTYGGVNSGALTYIPNLGADMAIRSGGSIFMTFTGNLAGQSDSAGTNYPSFEILNAADNSVLASVRLPIAGFGNSGRLDNYTIRILNNWGDLTIRWRLATRASGNTWAIVTNPQCSVYWTAL